MGAIQAPTPAMGPWNVEVRRQSAYVSTIDLGASPRATESANALRLPIEQVPHLVAALDQVMGHGAFKAGPAEWFVEGDDLPTPEAPTVRRDGNHVIFTGFYDAYRPNDYLIDDPNTDLRNTMEIEYVHTPALRDALAAVADEPR